jgi:hypothetical protein
MSDDEQGREAYARGPGGYRPRPPRDDRRDGRRASRSSVHSYAAQARGLLRDAKRRRQEEEAAERARREQERVADRAARESIENRGEADDAVR